jgi:hypothetical protein
MNPFKMNLRSANAFGASRLSRKLNQIQARLLMACGQNHRTPVPPQRWHLTTLSPFFSRPLPSQFLHFCFFLILGPFWLVMTSSEPWCVAIASDGAARFEVLALTGGGIPVYKLHPQSD